MGFSEGAHWKLLSDALLVLCLVAYVCCGGTVWAQVGLNILMLRSQDDGNGHGGIGMVGNLSRRVAWAV